MTKINIIMETAMYIAASLLPQWSGAALSSHGPGVWDHYICCCIVGCSLPPLSRAYGATQITVMFLESTLYKHCCIIIHSICATHNNVGITSEIYSHYAETSILCLCTMLLILDVEASCLVSINVYISTAIILYMHGYNKGGSIVGKALFQ